MKDITEMSVCNDALRPIYGPSSSHTYAPARIAFYTRKCFGDLDDKFEVKIVFFGGKQMAFQGHMSDRAVIGGLLNFSPYDDSFEEVKKLELEIKDELVYVKGRDTSFKFFINEKSEIPRAAFGIHIIVTDGSRKLKVEGRSIGGGDILIDMVEPVEKRQPLQEIALRVSHKS